MQNALAMRKAIKCLTHHASAYLDAMTTSADRLRTARVAAGYATAKHAAEAMGASVPTYIQHENGTRGYPASRAERYARFFRVSPEWLLYGTGAAPRQAPSVGDDGLVPVVGYVGANSAVDYLYGDGDGELSRVEPQDPAGGSTVAVEIRGSSLGRLFDGWLAFYDDVRTPVTPDQLGRLCVVGLPDNRVLVKWLRPARTPGTYHLESNTEETLFDQEVSWAARVRKLRPR